MASSSQKVRSSPTERYELFWLLWVLLAAFGSYFCMYGFRQPFKAGSFEGTPLWGIGFKTILVTSQVMGYMISKFIGIKVIAEMKPQRRAITMLWLILLAQAALILFGIVPRPYNALCLFLNGLPLGMVFGLVLGFLEGRRMTELFTAGLCASFILADGLTKMVGQWLLQQGIREQWMPSVAGGLYFVPFCLLVAMLACIPPPSDVDIALRSERFTMSRQQRWSFLCRNLIGLPPLILVYLLITIIRSIRSDYAAEIWSDLQVAIIPSTFTNSEIVIALSVLVVNGGAVLISDNRRAFSASLATCGLGLALMLVAIVARQQGQLAGFGFMVLIGLGLYLPYVAMHTTVFERLIGMTRQRGNIGFLMYVVDSVGYLGYVAVMIGRNFIPTKGNLLSLLEFACWITIVLSAASLLISWCYYTWGFTPEPDEADTASIVKVNS